MSNTEGTSLVLVQLQSDPKTVFEALLKRDPFTRLAIRENPGAALTALQQGEIALGLSQPTAARALDEVLDSFTDPLQAQEMMDAHLTIDRQAELIEAGGDLDRVAAKTAGFDTLYVAILNILIASGASDTSDTEDTAPAVIMANTPNDEDDAEEVDVKDEEEDALQTSIDSTMNCCVAVYRFAMKLRENPCFEDLLDTDLGKLRLREHLMLAAWNLANRPQEAGEVPADLFDNVSLDRDLCIEDLRDLLKSNRLFSLDLEEAQAVRQEILLSKNGLDRNQPSAEPTLDLG